jgi:hypothetical protein
MRKILMATLAAGALLAAAVPAEARDGCGPGYQRGPHGRCFPDRGRGYGRPRGPIVGTYYPGRGYWYSGRYWPQRYRHHGGWRYR